MAKPAPVRWFRFFTLPVCLASVALAIGAAEVSSPSLMYTAAAIGGAGLASLIVGRRLINYPDDPPPIRITKTKSDLENHSQPQHAVSAHH